MRRTRGAGETAEHLRSLVERYKGIGRLVALCEVGKDRVLWWDAEIVKRKDKGNNGK